MQRREAFVKTCRIRSWLLRTDWGKCKGRKVASKEGALCIKGLVAESLECPSQRLGVKGDLELAR